ncbi:MAG: peptidoglycan DD-metalloendopeptidase family protein [Symploca sp. SIO1B1]|nr:peptidoglycan DD-metalloendopeptidase family protein [Symploca sp. SIO1C2]NER92498.1 peptidoglycan DD-metalloendopeptidase family protein [Symploca sp. SIO1B1]
MGKIFISAGHYFQDPGASSALGTTEAEEMIQTRDLIIEELESRGLQSGRDFLSVPDTINLGPTISWINARSVAGDVALEIHGNAANGQVRGTECFYIDGNNERRGDAQLILDSLLQEVPELSSRGAKPDTATFVGILGFIRRIRIPSLLLELCFLDNLPDLLLLQNKRRQFAQGIAEGLIAFRDIETLRSGGTVFPNIDIEVNGEPYLDKGILVNSNSYIPFDLVDSLGIEFPPEADIRRVSQGGVVYVKAVDLQQFDVTVGWNATTRTVILNASPQEPIDQIMSNGKASEADLNRFLRANNQGNFVSKFPELPKIYIEEATDEGVNHDIAFCQMCLETNFLRFGGDVDPSQNNFSGIGAIGGGANGAFFPNARTGVKAQIQHLKAYASTAPIAKPPIVDPRFELVTRGVAPTVNDLSGRWATDPDYGTKILAILKRLYESSGIGDPEPPDDDIETSVNITQPQDGDEFEVDQAFTVAGTAAEDVATVSLYTPFSSTSFPLGTVKVIDGQWSAPVVFKTGGEREIIAEGMAAEGNSLDFAPEMISVLIGTQFVKPVRGGFKTSDFRSPNRPNHNGVDIGADRGTPIYAVADGTVTFVVNSCREGVPRCGGGFGNVVYIDHPALGLLTIYAHLQTVEVSSGEQVARGQRIGTMGNTGRSTGPHLHFEIRRDNMPLDPEDFISPIV